MQLLCGRQKLETFTLRASIYHFFDSQFSATSQLHSQARADRRRSIGKLRAECSIIHCCRRNIEIKPKVFLRKKILELDLHFIEVFTVEKY